ncbi:MAG: YidC/Oxa1 family insertase periplasmic-domain containing protein, partial [Gemmatimonadaceae bacterium]
MDKRTILALVLVAIVIIITPKLFPSATSRRGVVPDSTGKRSIAVAVPIDSVSKSAVSSPADTTQAGRARTAIAPGSDSATLPNATQAARAETTTVRSNAAQYDFTNMGAVPVDVRLLGYQALDKSGGNVVLTTGSGSLIDLRVLAPSDTIALRDVPFTVEKSAGPRGLGEVLTYRATVKTRPIVVKYSVVPDSFVAHVEGTVGNDSSGTAASYLLVTLPPTIHSFEADSLDDHNHLAFAIKPVTRAAEGIGFGKLDPGEKRVVSGPVAWAAAKSKYFIIGVLAPEGDQSLAEVQTIGGPRTGRTATHAMGTVVARLNNGAFRFDLYSGPQKAERLKALGRDFENSNPYGGWLQGVVQPFAAMVLKVLLWMRATFKLGYGWILIIFGIAVRLILWPLNHGAMRTSLKMQRIQPELNEVQ